MQQIDSALTDSLTRLLTRPLVQRESQARKRANARGNQKEEMKQLRLTNAFQWWMASDTQTRKLVEREPEKRESQRELEREEIELFRHIDKLKLTNSLTDFANSLLGKVYSKAF